MQFNLDEISQFNEECSEVTFRVQTYVHFSPILDSQLIQMCNLGHVVNAVLVTSSFT